MTDFKTLFEQPRRPATEPLPSVPRPYSTLAVFGGGAWGTALAIVAARAGCSVRLWMRDEALAREIARTRRNTARLGDIPLPDGVTPTADFAAALDGAEAVLLVTPSHTIREMAARIGAHAAPEVPLFVSAKGIEAQTGLMMSAVAEQAAPGRLIGVVSGPTFADETALGHPTAATVACTGAADVPPYARAGARMAASLTCDSFRPYVSDDMAGVEVGGAVKNVIAIACGMLAGAGFGENTRAALITRGLDEMKELAVCLGGRRETVTGLSGMGDLMLTCSSQKSRNFRYGFARGEGRTDAEVFGGAPVLVEGRHNAITVTDLARKLSLHMPICEMVRSVVADARPIGEAFAAFWAAPIQAEPRALDLAFPHPAEAEVTRRFEALLP